MIVGHRFGVGRCRWSWVDNVIVVVIVEGVDRESIVVMEFHRSNHQIPQRIVPRGWATKNTETTPNPERKREREMEQVVSPVVQRVERDCPMGIQGSRLV